MNNLEDTQEKEAVDQPVGNYYDELLEIVKRYWAKGKRGDLNKLVEAKAYERFGWTKGYFRQRVSGVLNHKETDYDLLQAMYDHILPRKTAIEKAVRDSVEIKMQRVNK